MVIDKLVLFENNYSMQDYLIFVISSNTVPPASGKLISRPNWRWTERLESMRVPNSPVAEVVLVVLITTE